jgi:tetratricopeptide (TPR) repeat protein
MANPESASDIYEKRGLDPSLSLQIQEQLQRVTSATNRREADELALIAITRLCDFLNHWNSAAHPDDRHVREAVEGLGRQLDQALARTDLKDIAMLHYGNGFFHRTQGNHEQALAEFDEAWRLSVAADRPLPQALSQSGSELVYLGEPLRALRQFRRAIDHSARKMHVRGYCFWALGRCLNFLERHDEAIGWLRLSVETWDAVSYNRLYLASSYEWADDHETAVATLREVDERFSRYTIRRVIKDEGTNPNRNPFVVAGRRRFHDGLLRAGMPEQ